jgi:hypothetical protein
MQGAVGELAFRTRTVLEFPGQLGIGFFQGLRPFAYPVLEPLVQLLQRILRLGPPCYVVEEKGQSDGALALDDSAGTGYIAAWSGKSSRCRKYQLPFLSVDQIGE